MLAVHATGFCKELWGPVAALLAPNPVVAPDQRGHGDSSTPPPPYDWWDLGRDLLEVVAAGGTSRPLGLGHQGEADVAGVPARAIARAADARDDVADLGHRLGDDLLQWAAAGKVPGGDQIEAPVHTPFHGPSIRRCL